MTNDELEVAFYKGSAVHDVLKRFKFSDDENKVITAAIITSRKQTPDMKIIAKADELLKEVAKSREPIKPTAKTEVSAEALAKMEAISIKQKYRDTEYTKSLNNSKGLIILLVGVLLAFTAYKIFYKKTDFTNTPITFEKAKSICKEQDKVLPLTDFDFLEIKIQSPRGGVGYWNSDGKIYYNLAMPLIDDDKQTHYARCVKVNGLDFPKVMR